jgi:hypothetical protein
LSSLSSKASINNPAPSIDPVSINEAALELKAMDQCLALKKTFDLDVIVQDVEAV